jgi:hypothetical protein
MLLLMSMLYLLHLLAGVYTQSRFVPELTVFTFIFASGIGWKYLFRADCRRDPNANMSHCFCAKVFTFWIHPLVHYLLPQRSGLFSMPVVITVTTLLLQVCYSGLQNLKSVIIAGILMGTLPLISAHSFIAVGEYALFICAAYFPWRDTGKWREVIKFWAIFGGTAMAVALPQILWLFRVPRKDFFELKPIWLETFPNSMKVFQLWWDSLGSFVAIAIFGVWRILTSMQIWGYLPALGVFLVSNFVRYQPGAMDNNKVFFAGWYVLACVAVSQFVVSMWNCGKRFVRPILVFIVVGYSLSSVVTIVKALRHNFPICTHEEKEMGLWILENTHKDSVFLGSAWHSNTAMSFGGRLITMGYGGWVWTHGLSYQDRSKLIQSMVADRENLSRFEDLKINYAIARTDDQPKEYLFPPPDDDSRWICVVEIPGTRLYRLLQT